MASKSKNITKFRLDVLLFERGLAKSDSEARELINSDKVLVNGETVTKAGRTFPNNAQIRIIEGEKFVSRGGEKLEAAIKAFSIDIKDKICADVGSSTGGFTDCLLRYGAKKVYAIDVGRGILDWKLRNDPRVVMMEKTNIKNVASLPDSIDIVVIDVSFISLRNVLPIIAGWKLAAESSIIALLKPQFEAGYKEVSRGKGVVRNKSIIINIINNLKKFAQDLGFKFHGVIPSPILGRKGNQEFLLWLSM